LRSVATLTKNTVFKHSLMMGYWRRSAVHAVGSQVQDVWQGLWHRQLALHISSQKSLLQSQKSRPAKKKRWRSNAQVGVRLFRRNCKCLSKSTMQASAQKPEGDVHAGSIVLLALIYSAARVRM
jgi:hypothetical protein